MLRSCLCICLLFASLCGETVENLVERAIRYRDSGDYCSALETYFAALAANPDTIDLQFGKPVDPSRTPLLPAGKVLCAESATEGKTLLVYHVKGHGDTLQFVRFLPQVIQQFKFEKILLVVQKALIPLVKNSEPILSAAVEVLDADVDLLSVSYDFHTHLLSLPYLLHTTSETIPFQGRYFNSFPASVPTMAQHKIGVVWQGDPTHIHDPARSIRLEMLRPLLALPDTKLFSLQVGFGSEQAKQFPIEDLSPFIHDFADLASFMDAMDVIVTIDSAAAHLASGLGKPTYILIPHTPDLRWAGTGRQGFWSESAVLIRQQQPGQWSDVIETLVEEFANGEFQ